MHPELARWFSGKFAGPSPAQTEAVPRILRGESVLVSAPTGTGKTLAAFLSVFDWLIRSKEAGVLPRGTVAIYVSPLRALAYDMQKNLTGPLGELGWDFITVGSRTGDTSAKERASQRRRPPTILVTTPESLTLLASQETWKASLRSTRFLIVDELHALVENKRGALLAVTAERLERFCEKPPIRIGLSATVSPLADVASYLGGAGTNVSIVDIPRSRKSNVELFSPLRENPYPPAGWTATRVLKELAVLISQRRTTLIFTNTRSGAETIGVRLKQLWAEEADRIEVHHASLDRAIRLEVEDRLKRGELRAVVCSTSLELGIDIGAIDTVVMISAPKGIARALQRVGRSGHSLTETSHGVLVASNVNDLVECAVTVKLMATGRLERVRFNENPLDVLAQQLVGMATDGTFTTDEAFALVRRARPFATLTRDVFDEVLAYLAGGGRALEKNYGEVFGKIRLSGEKLDVASPRVVRDYYQNVGTIASDLMVQVRLGRRILGQVEETFARRLRPGDVFVLNGRCVRFIELQLLTAKVRAAESTLPTVPRWNANKMPLTGNIADAVVHLRTEGASRLQQSRDVFVGWLMDEYDLSLVNAEAIEKHFSLQAEVSRIPTSRFFLIETYAERDTLHYFFHSLIGRSANDALSRIVAWRVSQAKGGNALATIDDYGFLLSVRGFQAMDQKFLRTLFAPTAAAADLQHALADANLVKWHFRNVAQTGLMVPRMTRGREHGPKAMQFSSEIIFDVLRQHEPQHPLLREAYAEATLRYLDLPRAEAFLQEVETLQWECRQLDRVSPFSFGMYVSKIKETMTLEDPETTVERLFHEMYGRRYATPE
ncbi:MAG: DEAD/DEAH box helicase [Opitutaceae bacterium]|nr:DEAD/DEAH box helicase [Opitutaceae bacterium]